MSNRRIESPDLNSDIELAPSGTKRAKVCHDGGIVIGSNSNDSDNIKLHRAATDKLEIVIGSDNTAEGTPVPPANLANLGMKGIAVSEVTASESIVGTSGTSSENIKLRRGGAGELEIVTANESAAEGVETFTNRTDVKMGSSTLGSSATSSENIKLHRGAAGMLEFIEGDDTTADGSEAVGVKANIFSKSISIGSGANGTGGKIFRSGPQELECSMEESVGIDGSKNAQYRAQFNFKGGVVGSSSSDSSNTKLHKSGINELEITKGDDTTANGSISPNKAQLNINNMMVGSSLTLANNVKLHRGSSKELEVVDGSGFLTETDGTRSSSKAQLNVKTLAVGAADDATHANNVKLHRGNNHEMEVVEADDVTADAIRSANKAQLNAKDVMVGSDGTTLTNNVKLHRSGNEEMEFLLGSSNVATSDGTAYPANRAKVNVGSLVVGKDTDLGENSKLHRYLNIGYATDEVELEIVAADDAVSDGAMASSGRRNLNVKGLTVGQSATSAQNAKLHRGGSGILEVVAGNDTTAEGTPSANKTQLSAKSLHVGTDATDSQNIKLHRGADFVMQAVQGDDATAEGTLSTALSQLSFKYETYTDGSEPVATGQEGRGFWNSTFKQLEMSNGTAWEVLGENKNRHLIENVGFTAFANLNTIEVRLKDQAGNDPSSGSPVRVAYRNPTLTNNNWYFRRASVSQLLTIDTGATLGTVNNMEGRIYVYLIDYGGNLQLAVSQKYHKDDTIVSTTALSSASDSIGVVYSESARANVALVNIGYFESTQTTAGTWGNNPSKVHIGDMGPKDDKVMTNSIAGPGDIALSSAATQTIPNASGQILVTNLDIDLTTTGRPIKIALQPGGGAAIGKLELTMSGGGDFSTTSSFHIYRDSVEIAVFELEKITTAATTSDSISFSPSCIEFIDDVVAGTYNYTIEAHASSLNGVLNVNNVKLLAYEL